MSCRWGGDDHGCLPTPWFAERVSQPPSGKHLQRYAKRPVNITVQPPHARSSRVDNFSIQKGATSGRSGPPRLGLVPVPGLLHHDRLDGGGQPDAVGASPPRSSAATPSPPAAASRTTRCCIRRLTAPLPLYSRPRTRTARAPSNLILHFGGLSSAGKLADVPSIQCPSTMRQHVNDRRS